MDSDPDYEWDGGGFSDYDDEYYGENFHNNYYGHSGIFHVDVDDDLDFDIGRIGIADHGGVINGGGDLTAEIGLDGGGDDDFNGGSDGSLTAEIRFEDYEFNIDRYEPTFRLLMDDNIDFPVTRDDITLTREIPVQTSQHFIESISNPNVRRNEEEKDRILMNTLKNDEMASSSEQGKKDSDANGSEDDGVSCPICLEPWITYGDHIICCLPCGHVYGFSCIKKWLQQPNSRKCPQCNQVCTIADIRKIYGLNIVTAEKDLKEKIQLLEAKCASLELHNADLQRKEAEWRRLEAVLVQQAKPVANK